MRVEEFVGIIDVDFYAGVPDSQLKALCDYLIERFGADSDRHVIAANEGNCAALAAGSYLATGKVPAVYMQNSGEGNIVNPALSLLSDRVYGIPTIFVIGWRGEPGVHDEPQHAAQGDLTLPLLKIMDMECCIVSKETMADELRAVMERFRTILEQGKSVAFVIRKNALTYDRKVAYVNRHAMLREEAIRCIVQAAGKEPVVCTTGRASRELFEIREANGQGHKYDFLTVGSMGHCSSVALGIAMNTPKTRIWCIDGDGAALMHMGAMAVIGARAPENLVHVIINNEAHETVGGMPTAAGKIDLPGIARSCGYPHVFSVNNIRELEETLEEAKSCGGLCMIEVKCAIGARKDLGRPTTTPAENKKAFMEYLEKFR